jgi:hypothetical protein
LAAQCFPRQSPALRPPNNPRHCRARQAIECLVAYQDLKMPDSFPQELFRAFGLKAAPFFPELLSDEFIEDELERRTQFDRAWQAVRYRYRACFESNEHFRALLAGASEMWKEWNADEEMNYKVEQCLYLFFMNGLSVFDSLAFCLYFVGGGMRGSGFPLIEKPKSITLDATIGAFECAFPHATVTIRLKELPHKSEFKTIKTVRNLIAHRVSGRRSIRGWSTLRSDTHLREERWYLPGSDEALIFDEGLLQRHLDEITSMLTTIVSSALEFLSAEVA